ncbi:hypothetical protein A5892_11600 [Halotalea alkalilenta]|uniref:Uncharacterized protein n=1 Tax=Halotalea alkalilenta TaxID=376489 RepID=A0A172YFI0_9GAMM|nr:hypothetical protein A5892_11600 [Halotalea alkalilenta]
MLDDRTGLNRSMQRRFLVASKSARHDPRFPVRRARRTRFLSDGAYFLLLGSLAGVFALAALLVKLIRG